MNCYGYLLSKILKKITKKQLIDDTRVLTKRGVLSAKDVNEYIYNKIIEGKPFMAGRLGGFECAAAESYLISKHILGIGCINNKTLKSLCVCAGFFPKKRKPAVRFAQLMIESVRCCDVQIRWWGGFENYIIEKYLSSKSIIADLPSFEPWQDGVVIPWSAALKGKKVLVIHPFENSIQSQYQKHDKLFPGTQILPEFDLKTVKAVQTIAGIQDNRFEDWFGALEYMYTEAMKQDFDIAIIGCGAYGYPLAAKIKQSGKQAIHFAGATQILFGIKGARWDSENNFGYLHKYFNEEWIYPDDTDKPSSAFLVEGGCYWK